MSFSKIQRTKQVNSGLPTTSKEAKSVGSTRYFTGKPCAQGHLSERATASRGCVECLARNSSRYRERNFSVVYKRECDNRDKRRDAILKYSRLRYKTHKDIILRHSKKWRLSNMAKEAARAARRKAALLRACPPWANHDQIDKFYALARSLTEQTGVRHEVDHIHPLRGEALCGLHVPWNLQILTKSENSRKKNKFFDAALSEKS